MKTKKILAVIATAIMLVSVLSAISIANAEKNINNEVKMEQGTTDRFGGGDYVKIAPTDSNKDWVFGVVYGTADNPNGITLFAGQTRYLGGAEIYEDGKFLAKRGIPVYTLFAQKFVFMAEFEPKENRKTYDLNADWNSVKQRLTATPIKGIDLRDIAWTIAWIDNGTPAQNNTYETWAFSLTAENINYTKVANNTNIGDGMLNKLQFTFHLSASLSDVEVPNVPWYKVDVNIDRAGKQITGVKINSAEFLETRNYTGTAVNAKFKYDHLIEGWDFASNNSRLVMETYSVYGKAVRSELYEWAKEKFMQGMKDKMGMIEKRIKERQKNFTEDATVNYESDSGEQKINETNAESQRPILLIPPEKRGSLTFDDNWYRVGAFRWVSNVSVTNGNITENKKVFFQIHGGMKIGMWNNIGEQGDKFLEKRDNIKNPKMGNVKDASINSTKHGYYFHGFVIKGAFIYPQGEIIFHDPEFDSSAVSFDIENENAQAKGAKLFFFLELVIAIVVISLLTVVILTRMRK